VVVMAFTGSRAARQPHVICHLNYLILGDLPQKLHRERLTSMNVSNEGKGTQREITEPTPIRMAAKAHGRKLPLMLLTCVLGLLFSLNCSAAVGEEKSTLVFVNTRTADRDKFDALIAKEFPKAKVLYTSVDSNVNDDVRDQIMLGVSRDGLKKYSSLVIIGDFKNATAPEVTLNSWMTEMFAAAKKDEAPQLHLLSTSRKPPVTYLRWVEVSGGKYRKLMSSPSGSYE
jgi:hypothetical protein